MAELSSSQQLKAGRSVMRLESRTTHTFRFGLAALALSIALARGNTSLARAQSDDASENGASAPVATDPAAAEQNAQQSEAQQAHEAADAAEQALESATAQRDQLESDGAPQDQMDARNRG